MSPAVPEAVVVTVSSRAAAGTRPDSVGPKLVDRLKEAGWDVVPDPIVVPDNQLALSNLLADLASTGHRLIVTTGGTGLTPTDRTPEATTRGSDFLVPGLAELMRQAGATSTPPAALSRGAAAARGHTLIVNVPGSPSGAVESLQAVMPLLRHAVDQLAGGDHH